MRRILIVFTLIVSSFFICNEVSADTIDFTINESKFRLLNEDFYALRDAAIDFINKSEEYNYYFIRNVGATNNVYFFNSGAMTLSASNSYFALYVYGPRVTYTINDGVFSSVGTSSNTLQIYVKYDDNILDFYSFLDTNYNFNLSSSFDVNITYKNFIYNSLTQNSFPSLYEIYLANEEPVEDKFAEDKELVSNFYIETINFMNRFTEIIVNNFIFLLIIGIFILIFIFELILRRYL